MNILLTLLFLSSLLSNLGLQSWKMNILVWEVFLRRFIEYLTFHISYHKNETLSIFFLIKSYVQSNETNESNIFTFQFNPTYKYLQILKLELVQIYFNRIIHLFHHPHRPSNCSFNMGLHFPPLLTADTVWNV